MFRLTFVFVVFLNRCHETQTKTKTLNEYKNEVDITFGKLIWRYGIHMASKLILNSASYLDGQRMRVGSAMEEHQFDGITRLDKKDKNNLSAYIYFIVMEVLYTGTADRCRMIMNIPGTKNASNNV